MFIKKTLLYSERNEERRANYMEIIKDIPLEDMVYIDESGIDHNGIKNDCWAKRGTKIIGERSGKRRLRTSVMAALNVDNINALMRFTGTANTELFLCWLENIFLPTLIVGQVVIMDNCSIHKSPKVRELIESVGCKLIYLPPYSPDLNPIENYWAVMKNQIKKHQHKFENILDNIDAVLMNTKRSFQN
jgi:transposase